MQQRVVIESFLMSEQSLSNVWPELVNETHVPRSASRRADVHQHLHFPVCTRLRRTLLPCSSLRVEADHNVAQNSDCEDCSVRSRTTTCSATRLAMKSTTTLRYPDRQSLPGSAERNAAVLSSHLRSILDKLEAQDIVLEIASGQGHLISELSKQHSNLLFQPTEADEHLADGISNRLTGQSNVCAPYILEIDSDQSWSRMREVSKDPKVVLIVNVLHIVPWNTVQSLWRQLAQFGTKGGPLTVCVYGAFDENGQTTSEGNQRFDDDLKSRNPEYGLRDLQLQVIPLAEENAFQLHEIQRLPAGNLLITFTRSH